MSDEQYDRASVSQQALINHAQWDRLTSELGLPMLLEFVDEFLDETQAQWIDVVLDPAAMDPKSFRSMAHKAAGAAAAIGLGALHKALADCEHAAIAGDAAGVTAALNAARHAIPGTVSALRARGLAVGKVIAG